jgi:Tfp pilus assembly protein PilO
MNLRLDFELLMKRHASLVVAFLVVLGTLGVAAAYVFGTSRSESVSAPVDDVDWVLDERYRAFRSLLIPQPELDARQQAVIDVALAHGLQTGRIDYGATLHTQDRYRVATLNFSVRGAYKDFRSFVTEVLTQHPALAIEDLSIQRAAQGGQIEARLRLAFFATAEETRP